MQGLAGFGEEPDASVRLDRDAAETIPFGLVRPAAAVGQGLDKKGFHWFDRGGFGGHV